MKKLIQILTLTTILSLSAFTDSRGQDSPDLDPFSTLAPPEPATADLRNVPKEAQQQFDHAERAFQLAQDEHKERIKVMDELVAQTRAIGASGGYGRAMQSEAWELPLAKIGRSSGGGRALVIRSGEPDGKAQADLEEDLAVMSRIFDKALKEKVGDQRPKRTAMGIDVFFVPGSGTGSVRSMYLDGYGALFMLNVSFPLLAPPVESGPEKEKPTTDTAWEEARREVYGQPDTTKLEFGQAEDYDEAEVTKLKNALLESFKNAANIRNLKADDFISVCVFGGRNGAPAKLQTSTRSSGDDRHRVVSLFREDGGSARGTIMTIRAKKSDVDAFAKGRLNLDDFRKKANITAYAGDAGGTGGGATSISGGGRRGGSGTVR